jgi:hypothetical protein
MGRKKRMAVATAALVAVGGGAAFAYWSATGTGSATARTTQSAGFKVTSDAATGGPLSPGGPTQTVGFTVTNPGSGVQHLTKVDVKVSADLSAKADSSKPACTAADFTIDEVNFTAGDIASAAAIQGTVLLSMKNLPSNQDNCQGVDVPLVITAG